MSTKDILKMVSPVSEDGACDHNKLENSSKSNSDSECEGCKNIALRYPYPSMFPCNCCSRVNRKDYYEKE